MAVLSTDQWREDLDARLSARQPRTKLYRDYYDGDHRLLFATNKFREAFGDIFGPFATNWCELVVDVACERLAVLGFRFGEDDADEEAWRIWQANGLDAKSLAAHTEAVKAEESYLLVSPPRTPGGEPRITVEYPSQCIVAVDPADPSQRLAGFKKYRDLDGTIVQVVYEADQITMYRQRDFGARVSRLEALGVYIEVPRGPQDWDQRIVQPNPLGSVPLIPLANNPDGLEGGRSDLSPAIHLNDAANKFFLDMIHASEFTSFPQRVLTGVDLEAAKNPDGSIKPEAEIRAAISRLWAFESKDAKVFELPVGTLQNYVEGIDLAVQHLAAQTRTPPHYLLAKIANLSGDALKAAETGLVARCRRKHLDFSDAWEEAMRLAFRWRSLMRRGWAGASDDAARAEMEDAETIWLDPESKDPINLTQSLTNKKTIGVPDEVLWEEAGYTPQQIKRMRKLRDEEVERQMKLAQAGGQAGGDAASPGVQVQDEGASIGLGLPAPPPEADPKQNGGGKPKPTPAAA